MNKSIVDKMDEALKIVTEKYGVGYAESHPELIASCMNAICLEELNDNVKDLVEAYNRQVEAIQSLNSNLTIILDKK